MSNQMAAKPTLITVIIRIAYSFKMKTRYPPEDAVGVI